jgi:hypothetical protein
MGPMPSSAASPAPTTSSRALALRFLFAALGAFTAATVGWIGWGIITPGDTFANGNPWVDVTVLALGALGGYAAFKRGSRRVRIAAAVASTLSAIFWVAVPNGWWAHPPPRHADDGASSVPTVDDLREAEHETHLTFPANKRILLWKTTRAENPRLRMKFEMAAEDWPAFVAASPFRDRPLREEGGANLGADYGAWDPYEVPHLIEGEVRLPAILNLGADMSRPGVVVVYLVWQDA